jgi:uroporphyrin-3 C-methyltransferase
MESGVTKADTAAATVAPRIPSSGGRGAGSVFGIIALVISILAFLVAAYLWYQSEVIAKLESGKKDTELLGIGQKLAAGSERVADIKSEQEALNTAYGELRQQLLGQESKLLDTLSDDKRQRSTEIDALRAEFQSLSDSVSKVYQQLNRSLDSWTVEEVEQLLLLANHRLQLSRNIDLAVTALRLADQRLEDFGDPQFLPVRKVLAADIAKLDGVTRIDMPGLTLRLAGLAGAVDGLPLLRQARPVDTPIPEVDLAVSDRVANAARQIWNDLLGLVRVKEIDKTRKPLLMPEQHYFVTENLRIALNSAQFALLRDDPAAYQRNLDNAKAWITEMFDSSDAAVASLLTEIDALLAEPVQVELPDISGSLAALREVISVRSVQ